MWPEQDGVSEPDWVKTEREQFKSFRDKNGDGRMDSSEVRDWVMPDDYDHTEAESKHLIFESDLDRVCTVCALGSAYNEFGYNEQIFPSWNVKFFGHSEQNFLHQKSLTAVLKCWLHFIGGSKGARKPPPPPPPPWNSFIFIQFWKI